MNFAIDTIRVMDRPKRAPAAAPRIELTAVDRVAAAIRENVRFGRLVPDQRLVEADLTEICGVSRGTVREAIRKLVAEGLLTQEPNRSTRVRRMSQEEVTALYRVRESLEGLAARMAAENISESGYRRRLRELRNAMESSIASEDVESYYHQNEQLHSLIVEMSGNSTLIRLVDQLRISAFRLQFWKGDSVEMSKRSHADHGSVLRAILAGEANDAEVAMRAHIRNSASFIDWSDGAAQAYEQITPRAVVRRVRRR